MKSFVSLVFVFALSVLSGVFAAVTSNGGYKIHGDGYKCDSYETAEINKTEVTKNASLALNSYADQLSNAGGREGYTPLTAEEIATKFGIKESNSPNGNDLRVVVESSGVATIVAKDEKLLNAVIYKKDGTSPEEYTIAYRGSEKERIGDWVDDAKQYADKLGVIPQQYKDASNLFKTVLDSTAAAGNKITCTGHSLGGGLVTYVMCDVDYGSRKVSAYTYNAVGLSDKTMDSFSAENVSRASGDIINIRNQLDFASYVAFHVGKYYEVTTVASEDTKHTIFNDHSMNRLLKNMEAANNNAGVSSLRLEGVELENQKMALEQAIVNSGQSLGISLGETGDDNSNYSLIMKAIDEEVKNNGGTLGTDLTGETLTLGSLSDAQDDVEACFKKWDQQIDALKREMGTDDDRNALQKAVDFAKSKIKEGIEKGEEWVENGGIRKLIQSELDKVLTGKVSDQNKARILNLADKLCNINKDGGRSFGQALGTDGVDLLRSLALKELEKQISKALPKDVADNINKYIEMLNLNGVDIRDPAARQKLLDIVKAGISEYLPYKNSAAELNGLLQDIFDGKSIDVLNTAQNFGTSLGVDLLKDVLSKNLDPELAAKINALLDGFAQNGLQGVADASIDEIKKLIDQYAPGSDSAKQLKGIVDKLVNGTITSADFKDTATSLVGDTMNKLIDQSNLPPGVKDAAKQAVDILKKNGLTNLNQSAQDFITDYVTDKLGKDAGAAAGEIFHAMITPGEDVWTALQKDLPIIGKAIGTQILAKIESLAIDQINKFIGNHPVLKEIFGALGLNGSNIVSGIKNIWGIFANSSSITTAFKTLAQNLLTDLKQIALNVIKWGLDKLVGLLNNLINDLLDKIINKLGEWASATNFGLLQKGLQWLQSQACNCKKNGSIRSAMSGLSAKAVEALRKMNTFQPQTDGTRVYDGTVTAPAKKP